MISFYFPLCSFSKALLEWLKCLSPLRLTTLQIIEKSSPFTFIENLWCVSQVLCHISSNIRFIIVWCTAEKEKIWPTTLWCVLLWYMFYFILTERALLCLFTFIFHHIFLVYKSKRKPRWNQLSFWRLSQLCNQGHDSSRSDSSPTGWGVSESPADSAPRGVTKGQFLCASCPRGWPRAMSAGRGVRWLPLPQSCVLLSIPQVIILPNFLHS